MLTFIAPAGGGALRPTLGSLQAQTRCNWDLLTGEGALERATGDLVAFVDPGDTLAPDTVERVLTAAERDGVDCIYTDEDEIDDHGQRSNPFLKPAWSPDRLRCQAYTGRLCALRRSVVQEVGGFRPEAAGAHEHDLVLRVTERARAVAHLPHVLYHRRMPPGGVATRPTDRDAARQVVNEHLDRVGFPAEADLDSGQPGLLRLRPRLRAEPLVSLVIPTAGRSRLVRGTELTLVLNCVESIVKRSTYGNYEIVCVIGDEVSDATRSALRELAGDRLRLVSYQGAFNFARAVNLGVLHSDAPYALLLNDDTQVITPEWIESMLMFAVDDGVGAVGAKLLFGDGRIQHAGIISPGRGGPGHHCYGFPGRDPGYADHLLVPGDYLAVTGACMLTKRACFDAVGGFASAFPLNYNDVDYCLKLRHRGWRVVYSPDAALFHFEWSSRVSGQVTGEELQRLNERWGSVLDRDPYYNPGFLPSTDFRPPFRTAAAARRADASPSLRVPSPALP